MKIYIKKNRNKSSHLHGTYTQMNEKEKKHFFCVYTAQLCTKYVRIPLDFCV